MSKRSPIEQVKSKKPEKLNIEMCLEVGMVRERLEAQGQEMKALHATIARLTTELAEAREDSERLDAVQRGSWTVHYRSMNSRWELLTDHAHPAHRKTYTGKTARAAIDAARKQEGVK
jgi:uncharacterized protein YigA (DUF484 family)